MTEKKEKTNRIVPFYILISVIVLQLGNLLVVSAGNYHLNGRTFIGSFGSNYISVSIAILVLIYFLFLSKYDKISKPSFILVSAGAISNILDRIFRGGAVDYFHLWWIPDFNLADLSIILGFIFLIWPMMFDRNHREP